MRLFPNFSLFFLQENGGGLGELSHSDLSGLETGLEPEEDAAEDIFKQLSDTSFELEHLFDLTNEVKVIIILHTCILRVRNSIQIGRNTIKNFA